MKKLVIYDSYFGNTAVIAETIAKELDCEHIKVHAFKAEMVNDFDCLVIGSPTRAFTATKAIKQLIKKINRTDVNVALFDTRMQITDDTPKPLKAMVNKFGYANDTMEKMIHKKGIIPCFESGKFYVTDSEGPLDDDAIESAKAWVNAIKEKNNEI